MPPGAFPASSVRGGGPARLSRESGPLAQAGGKHPYGRGVKSHSLRILSGAEVATTTRTGNPQGVPFAVLIHRFVRKLRYRFWLSPQPKRQLPSRPEGHQYPAPE